ncbi:hypothetical protein K402DRAFT_418589 [Aulographum hederae CBS 113979]|uniref:Uncharacterized protein n=1 Tax=Aulographum hederae CBS 113979 TaxID=1176131 RepID=A0A6G1H814_9PEZI|nr:hypothetical protein K402DRAFT_418589 [Aulographum hederae CBS 113979]
MATVGADYSSNVTRTTIYQQPQTDRSPLAVSVKRRLAVRPVAKWVSCRLSQARYLRFTEE